jgi:hypothetical protein
MFDDAMNDGDVSSDEMGALHSDDDFFCNYYDDGGSPEGKKKQCGGVQSVLARPKRQQVASWCKKMKEWRCHQRSDEDRRAYCYFISFPHCCTHITQRTQTQNICLRNITAVPSLIITMKAIAVLFLIL